LLIDAAAANDDDEEEEEEDEEEECFGENPVKVEALSLLGLDSAVTLAEDLAEDL
jgi:hypothetical protein